MIGILGAMKQELDAVLPAMVIERTVELGGRRFYQGILHGIPAVLVVSRIGKVAAATTATILLERFSVQRVLFTGLAGGISHEVRRGDIVIANALIHHDLDARPLFARYEIPLLGLAKLPTDDALTAALTRAAQRFVESPPAALARLGITQPRVHVGLVASGDQFISSRERVAELRATLPAALAVEMEGAAVAQVCFEHGIPFAVARVLSDHADDDAESSFTEFLREACGLYAQSLIEGALR